MKQLIWLLLIVTTTLQAQLPITLKTFDVVANDNQLNISFVTASEVNIDSFYIYENENVIKVIKGNNLPSNYSFIHNPKNEYGIITLISKDYDGKTQKYFRPYDIGYYNKVYSKYDYMGRFYELTDNTNELGFIYHNNYKVIKK